MGRGTIKLCKKFLMENGWSLAGYDIEDEDYLCRLTKENNVTIDILIDEIVLINDRGDFLHIPINYYALIGALIDNRLIAIDYNSGKGGSQ